MADIAVGYGFVISETMSGLDQVLRAAYCEPAEINVRPDTKGEIEERILAAGNPYAGVIFNEPLTALPKYLKRAAGERRPHGALGDRGRTNAEALRRIFAVLLCVPPWRVMR